MSPVNIPPYPKTANEPKVHPLIENSFIFVPSAGMRLAPEVLVLELMREVFFERHYGNTTGTKYLDPDDIGEGRRYIHEKKQRAVLHALKGRRKKSRSAKAQRFYAPAYPQLAKNGWLGKNREHVVNNFLLSGPISQYLWHGGFGTQRGIDHQSQLVDKIWRALLGGNSCVGQDPRDKDILAVTLGLGSFDCNPDLPKRNLLDRTDGSRSVFRTDRDEIAFRITHDLIAICDLESELPRMQWVQLLMTFLRFALPIWLLSQMQLTPLIHAWLIDAVDMGNVASDDFMLQRILLRNRGLLHPTLTSTRELFEHIERYMKCRVEVNILLYCLKEVTGDRLDDKSLNLEGGGRDKISIGQLLSLARESADALRNLHRFRAVADGADVRTFLTREGEAYGAWRNPLMLGQGKNIDEFFRVLYRAEAGDESGGYLLVREGRAAKSGFLVFPGQMLLKAMTFLAAESKWSSHNRGGSGKLVLQDVEEHFGQYGIDFSAAADARPLLMKELQAMGLLTGSPDAGSSVAVSRPY